MPWPLALYLAFSAGWMGLVIGQAPPAEDPRKIVGYGLLFFAVWPLYVVMEVIPAAARGAWETVAGPA